jgi:hypothetical protein
MANEAVIVELLGDKGDPIRYTCAEAVTIAKGTILKLADPRTVSATAAADDPVAGIAAAEKVGGDGATTIAAYTNGIFDLKESNAGGLLVGVSCAIAGANIVTESDANDLLQSSTVGMCLEAIGAAGTGAVRVLK